MEWTLNDEMGSYLSSCYFTHRVQLDAGSLCFEFQLRMLQGCGPKQSGWTLVHPPGISLRHLT